MVYPVFTKTYPAPPINRREILRYAGVKGETAELDALLDECLKELDGKLSCKVCYSEYPVKIEGDAIDLTFAMVSSKDLAKNLKGCGHVLVFAATVGLGVDRLIAKYGSISPTKSLLFQAIGAERIESLCNLFNEEIKEKYASVRPRFSAGYGDFPLEIQTSICNALSCYKNIGVSLNQSLLMSPSKSVTAIIGIADDGCSEQKSGCPSCNKTDCAFRSDNET